MQPNIIIVRHAHTYWNCCDRVGYTDELDRLTPQWILQAIGLWPKLQWLIEAFWWKVNIACSETRRTYETAVHAGVITPFSNFTIHSHLNEFETDENFLSSLASLRKKDLILPDWLTQVQDRMLKYLRTLDESRLHILFSHGASIWTVYHAVDPWLATIPGNASINTFTLKNWVLTIN